jgi:hypothetical protein
VWRYHGTLFEVRVYAEQVRILVLLCCPSPASPLFSSPLTLSALPGPSLGCVCMCLREEGWWLLSGRIVYLCLGGVAYPRCHIGVTGELQGCYGTAVVLQACYRVVSRVLQGCVTGLCYRVVLQGSYKGVTVPQWC